MGVELGFNSQHHDKEEATETTVHLHADGKKHQHHDEVGSVMTFYDSFGIDIFQQPQYFNQKFTIDFFHPPPPDIRILIQSFQIWFDLMICITAWCIVMPVIILLFKH